MKRKIGIVFGILAVVLFLFLTGERKDTPPKFALNGVDLNLEKIHVSDLNDAGFYLDKNDSTLAGNNFRNLLSYYNGDDHSISMGGVSILNRGSGSLPYTKCQIFEITAKSRDKEGNLTNLEATYNGEHFFGKTKEELISLFGEPDEESVSYLLVYKTKRKNYKTTFTFDTHTGECYMVEIDRYEKGLVR